MWLNNRERIVCIACMILLIPGILYFFWNPRYHQYYINDLKNQKSISFVSEGAEANELIMKVSGVSSVDYILQLRLLSKTGKDSAHQHIAFERIKIPAGTVSGNFKRDFLPGSLHGKAEIVYFPTNPSGEGSIKIEGGIF